MLLDDAGDLLTSAGVGVKGSSGDYGIFLGALPASPAKCIALLEAGGLPAYRSMSSGPAHAVAERPRLQVLVRSTSYSSGRQKINDIVRTLDGLAERTINGTRYLYAEAVQPPFLLERDANERFTLACNFDLVKELSTA